MELKEKLFEKINIIENSVARLKMRKDKPVSRLRADAGLDPTDVKKRHG